MFLKIYPVFINGTYIFEIRICMYILFMIVNHTDIQTLIFLILLTKIVFHLSSFPNFKINTASGSVMFILSSFSVFAKN